MYGNICNSFCCTPSFGVLLQKICAQNNKYGQTHTIVEHITNQKQHHKFLTKTHTKNPVLPKKMDRQNSLSCSIATGTGWCSMALSSVEYGATAFSDAEEDRLYLVHKLEKKLEDAPSVLHVSGSTEAYIHEGTTLSQSSVSFWAVSRVSNHPTHTFRQLRAAHLSQHPFRSRKLLLHSPRGQASRVCNLQFCSRSWKQLETGGVGSM